MIWCSLPLVPRATKPGGFMLNIKILLSSEEQAGSCVRLKDAYESTFLSVHTGGAHLPASLALKSRSCKGGKSPHGGRSPSCPSFWVHAQRKNSQKDHQHEFVLFYLWAKPLRFHVFVIAVNIYMLTAMLAVYISALFIMVLNLSTLPLLFPICKF